MNQPTRVSLILLAAILLGVGCDRNETAIRTYSAPKDEPAVDVAATGPITWKVPAGWQAVPGSSEMRYATFQVSKNDPKAQLTVVRLPAAAGALMPNLIRWAGQLKLPQPTQSDAMKYVQPTQVSGEQAMLVDMTGSAESGNPPTRLLAAIIPHDSETWFFTLKAAAPLVENQKSNFDQFIHSIEFHSMPTDDDSTASATPPPTPPTDSSTDAQHNVRYKLTKWKTPDGWTEEPGQNEMRVTGFHVGSGTEQAEVLVTRMPPGSFGSVPDNINRWRGQVGLDPVEHPEPDSHENVQFADHESLLINFNGPADGTTRPRELQIVIDQEGSDFWFVKILGPKTLVDSQHEAFKQFLQSMQFEPESH